MAETKSVAVVRPERRLCPDCQRDTEHWVTDMTEGDTRVVIRTCLTCRREIAELYDRVAAEKRET